MTKFTFLTLFALYYLCATTCFAQETISIAWSPRPYDDQTANVGDIVQFSWVGTHNVHIHPTGTCDETGAILVGDQTGTSYVFADDDAGTDIYFACDIGQHCEVGQIVKFTVEAAVAPEPTATPVQPTPSPIVTELPTSSPTTSPVEPPTPSPVTTEPTAMPTLIPVTLSPVTTETPTMSPSNVTSEHPSYSLQPTTPASTIMPSFLPTMEHSASPTEYPTIENATMAPTMYNDTLFPTSSYNDTLFPTSYNDTMSPSPEETETTDAPSPLPSSANGCNVTMNKMLLWAWSSLSLLVSFHFFY